GTAIGGGFGNSYSDRFARLGGGFGKYLLPIYAASAIPCALNIGDGIGEGIHPPGDGKICSLDDDDGGDPLDRFGGGVRALTFCDPI
ncbi:MAG: hypothetical protein ACKPKO_52360, partial [Candidatus Fonsibacter sp.]